MLLKLSLNRFSHSIPNILQSLAIKKIRLNTEILMPSDGFKSQIITLQQGTLGKIHHTSAEQFGLPDGYSQTHYHTKRISLRVYRW
jgi:hypothetical protein